MSPQNKKKETRKTQCDLTSMSAGICSPLATKKRCGNRKDINSSSGLPSAGNLIRLFGNNF